MQGIIGHVGSGHEAGWEKAVVPPTTLHGAVSVIEPAQSLKIEKVRDWLRRNDVNPDAFDIHIHQGYGTVQLRFTGHRSELSAFLGLVDDLNAYHYNGDVGWLDNSFVDDLPDVNAWMADHPSPGGVLRFTEPFECDSGGCTRTDGVRVVRTENGPERRLCPVHAKHHLEVSS